MFSLTFNFCEGFAIDCFANILFFNFASQGNNLLGRSLQSNTLVYLSSEDNWSEEKHSEKYLINKSISGKLLLNIPVLTQLIYPRNSLIYLLFSKIYRNTGFETRAASDPEKARTWSTPFSVLNVKTLICTFNYEKALHPSRGILRDWENRWIVCCGSWCDGCWMCIVWVDNTSTSNDKANLIRPT